MDENRIVGKHHGIEMRYDGSMSKPYYAVIQETTLHAGNKENLKRYIVMYLKDHGIPYDKEPERSKRILKVKGYRAKTQEKIRMQRRAANKERRRQVKG